MIGRFSALSVADLVNVTSFYHGKAYYYVMNKDVDQLHIDLLYEKTTTEHDGVEVKVPIKTWNTNTLRCLSFIDNIYVESELSGDEYRLQKFNKRKIIAYNNFKVITDSFDNEHQHTEILFGKIPYTVDYWSLWSEDDDWHHSWEECFRYVYPQLNIGDLDITPNREGLLYSERTKEALRKKYDECIEELQNLWNAQCTNKYTDLMDYINSIVIHRSNYLLLDDISVPISNNVAYNALYENKPEWDNIPAKDKKHLLACIWNKEIDILGKLQYGELQQGNRTCSYYTIRKLVTEHWLDREDRIVLALPNKSGFTSQYFKGFIINTYKKEHVLFIRQLPEKLSIRNIRSILRSMFISSDYQKADSRKFMFQLVKETLRYISSKVISTSITDNEKYIQYKKNNAIKKQFKHTENIRFTVYTCNSYYPSNLSMKTSEIIDYVRREWDCRKYRFVYADLNSPFIAPLTAMKYPRLVILAVTTGKLDTLREDMPEWVRPIEELYSEDNRVLQKYAAIKYINDQGNLYFNSQRFIPASIRSAIHSLVEYRDKYICRSNASFSDIADAKQLMNVVPYEKYDRTIMALYHESEKYMRIAWKLNQSLAPSAEGYYLLMKHKKVRLDYAYYKIIKDKVNNLLNSI